MPKRPIRRLLTAYFNGGWISRQDGLLSMLNPRLPLEKHAGLVSRAVIGQSFPPAVEEATHITIPVYNFEHPSVIEMRKALEPVSDDIKLAAVHGSLATDEIIPYSDFDGLLIFKESLFRNIKRLPEVALAIHQARSIMYRMDPLQHHGWFVMTEQDLESYPGAYLPHEVLARSLSITGEKDVQLQLFPEKNPDYFGSVKHLCRRIRRMGNRQNRPVNLYQLKSMLSEFMMLPSLYVQARDHRGIFKKDSFAAAAVDFNPVYWSVMDEVSNIRENWEQEISLKQKHRLERTGYFWMMYRKRFGPLVPAKTAQRLTDDLYRRMALLANQVEINLFR